jgi:membrane-anchored protein YejM (alkaline phosphatase superfamily)
MKNRILNRRQLLKGMGIAVGWPLTTRPLSARETTVRGPNILVIHVDQHRTDCLGTYGNVDVQTPHIDRLAADGVRYTNSFSISCVYPVPLLPPLWPVCPRASWLD